MNFEEHKQEIVEDLRTKFSFLDEDMLERSISRNENIRNTVPKNWIWYLLTYKGGPSFREFKASWDSGLRGDQKKTIKPHLNALLERAYLLGRESRD